MFEGHPRATGGRRHIVDFFIDCDLPSGKSTLSTWQLQLGQRGAVVADNWGLSGRGANFTIEYLEPADDTYRMALLFNDVVDLPKFPEDCCPPDMWDLEAAKLIRRSCLRETGAVTFERLASLEAAVLEQLNNHEPGTWSLWHEPDHDPIPEEWQLPDGAVRVAFQNAILVPGIDVPFDDIVEFRVRNLPQLRKLRQHMDELAIKIAKGGPDPALFRLELEKFDVALAEYTEEARRPNWRKALGDLQLSINWLGGAAAGASALALGVPLFQAAAVAGVGAVSSLELKSTRGLKVSPANSPFEYIARIHRDLA